MFIRTALVYPAVLTAMCLGAGLLVDRLSGSFVPTALLPAVGLAGLIAVSQLVTYVPALATGTPYALVATAALGVVLARARLVALVRRAREGSGLAPVPVLAYA